MKFVHVVRINDPLDPAIRPLSRQQVWSGLLSRAERPKEFMPQLDACRIVVRSDKSMARELNFGSFVVRDRVRLEPMQQMTYETEGGANVPAGTLTIRIEEPGPEQLQVRFEYDIARQRTDDIASEEMYDRFLKGAYLEADIDCVRIIRQLAEAGLL